MNIGKIKEETLAINRILLRHKDLNTTIPINAKQGQNDAKVSKTFWVNFGRILAK